LSFYLQKFVVSFIAMAVREPNDPPGLLSSAFVPRHVLFDFVPPHPPVPFCAIILSLLQIRGSGGGVGGHPFTSLILIMEDIDECDPPPKMYAVVVLFLKKCIFSSLVVIFVVIFPDFSRQQ